MEGWTATIWFFSLTGLISLVTGIIRVRRGYWKAGTKQDRIQIVALFIWVVLASLVVYTAIFGGSDYVDPRAFENI